LLRRDLYAAGGEGKTAARRGKGKKNGNLENQGRGVFYSDVPTAARYLTEESRTSRKKMPNMESGIEGEHH